MFSSWVDLILTKWRSSVISTNKDNIENSDEGDWVSKSEQKRQVKALTALGERLVQMPEATLDALPIPANLMDAILRAKKITKRGGLRRELLFIGKIMRSIDTTEIQDALQLVDHETQQDKEAFHELEQWRERLITSPDALKEFIDQYPNTDIQSLRQQLRLHTTAKKPAQKTKAYRLIFQIIKDACSG